MKATIHAGLNTSTPIPKQLKTEISKQKRSLNTNNLSNEPPNKKHKSNANNITINWKDNYRKRRRKSPTRKSILNSLNNKTCGEIANHFPLMQSGAAKDCIRIRIDNKQRKKRTKAPIIIVPDNNNNSLLTFSNCVSFLKENKYIYNKSSQQQPIKTNKHSQRIKFQMKSYLDPTNKTAATFEIRPSSSFKKNTPRKDWDRIVAIFIIGKEWQFKRWAHGWKKPEEIFNKTSGFYMHFKDDPTNEIVKKWRVNYLPIMRNERHDDARVAKQFWSTLYQHLKSKHRNKRLYF